MFKYTALDAENSIKEGVIDGTDKTAAAQSLIRQGLRPLQIKGYKAEKKKGFSLPDLQIGKNKITRADIDFFTKQIALVPTSAERGTGIPELLMVMTGLAQRFLNKCLECDKCAPSKGIILEVKEEKGIGKSLDVIIYDGCLKINDTIVIGSLGEPIVTKVKSLFQPAPIP